ncbi:Terpene synthase family, metal binding domain [Micromonospora purpureochromogenes]|uniref:Terpene synthase n=1 Tax=Micromonospora purpureochromogenes TaxID=47872 RepID=A0A1C4X7B5_9ACTN|nr:terpene synthase [Micromonospora purpureochromogenes]SCF04267.1 Terpene synthase family, metal binding domain [Micromonospora purpureochromogenes]
MRGIAGSGLHEPPFPARRHSATGRVAAESLTWARSLGLVEDGPRWHRLRAADAAELAGRACPRAPVDRLRLLTDLITWLFVVDDSCDEDDLGAEPGRLAPTVGALLDVLDRHGADGGAAPAGGPLGIALADICRRVRAHRRPALLLRLVAELREYLLALLWEAANRQQQRVPELAEYLQLRRHTGGVRPSLTLTDLAYDVRPGRGGRTDPAVLALDDLTTDLVCWCNDLFSHRKELRGAPDPHNLVTVIAAGTGQDVDAAVRTAAGLFNDRLDHYLVGEAALAGDPVLAPFLEVRRSWIRATYDWSLRAVRYA